MIAFLACFDVCLARVSLLFLAATGVHVGFVANRGGVKGFFAQVCEFAFQLVMTKRHEPTVFALERVFCGERGSTSIAFGWESGGQHATSNIHVGDEFVS